TGSLKISTCHGWSRSLDSSVSVSTSMSGSVSVPVSGEADMARNRGSSGSSADCGKRLGGNIGSDERGEPAHHRACVDVKFFWRNLAAGGAERPRGAPFREEGGLKHWQPGDVKFLRLHGEHGVEMRGR